MIKGVTHADLGPIWYHSEPIPQFLVELLLEHPVVAELGPKTSKTHKKVKTRQAT